jgi:hypothetical protein
MTSRPKRTKLLKPSAAQAMIVRRYEFLQNTVGPQLKITWEALPTKREFAEHARVYVDIAVRSKKASRKPKEGPYWPDKKQRVFVDDFSNHCTYDWK